MRKETLTITKLKNILKDAGIPKSYYSIGKAKEDAYCIEEINGLWAFYTVEHGKKYDSKVFTDFDSAAKWLIHNLLTKTDSVIGML